MNIETDFLHRVAAFLMVHILYDVPSVSALGVTPDIFVDELRFESNNVIDDLVLMTSQGRFFIQAKHALSLSDCCVSEYSSVLRQFIVQFCSENIKGDRYIIATNSGASPEITKELKNLAEMSRINGTHIIDSPQTDLERDVISKTRSLLEFHFKSVTGEELQKRVLEEIFSKIHVAVIDIEAGKPLEKAVMSLLADKSGMNSDEIWEAMISMCSNGKVILAN
ncbi:MAG: hypothetical protein R3189_09205 [Thiomicrorhabdus chilensis]|uniref:hypothetical protein n=1 Tax=Thiomicrorhabdus chilensis TaxID=63656 RepID=UPI00299D5BFB|nr:hypothetical protein [Thiomicrorhabdus chilensis]MDX1348410.1 hypothetical protein [Thiomicrorhabdus chilensis]